MLTQRKEDILRIIIGEHVATAMPVASENIARKHLLGVSAATIRNEMVGLEEEGYINQPYHSAGRIPSDKGYRYYIESLMEDAELPLAEQHLIRHQFHQVENDIEEWIRLAATALSHMVQNVAIVTWPKPIQSCFRHLELISLQEFLALLILVLKEAKLKQQMLTLIEAASQVELSAIANKLNAAYLGLTAPEIWGKGLKLSPLEEQVTTTTLGIMQAEDRQEYEEPYVEGLRRIFSQPEFSTPEKIRGIMEVLEEKNFLKTIISQALIGEGICVVVGRENREDAMRHCSVIVSRYGISGQLSGAIGVVGPTRMQYERAIPAVRCLTSIMNELLAELYG